MGKKTKFRPLGYGVIVELDKPEAVVSRGGIDIPEEVDSDKIRRFKRGRINKMGPDAFDYLRPEDRPKIGDLVGCLKQAGMVLDEYGEEARLTASGMKEPLFRVFNDKDIRVVIEEGEDE